MAIRSPANRIKRGILAQRRRGAEEKKPTTRASAVNLQGGTRTRTPTRTRTRPPGPNHPIHPAHPVRPPSLPPASCSHPTLDRRDPPSLTSCHRAGSCAAHTRGKSEHTNAWCSNGKGGTPFVTCRVVADDGSNRKGGSRPFVAYFFVAMPPRPTTSMGAVKKLRLEPIQELRAGLALVVR
jgi:hypothetical protein